MYECRCRQGLETYGTTWDSRLVVMKNKDQSIFCYRRKGKSYAAFFQTTSHIFDTASCMDDVKHCDTKPGKCTVRQAPAPVWKQGTLVRWVIDHCEAGTTRSCAASFASLV